MKILFALLVVGLLASCQVPVATSSKEKCLSLTGMKKGKFTFQVNDSSKSHKPHGGYQRDYFVLVYEDQSCRKLISSVFLPRKSEWPQSIKLDSTTTNYCVVIYKERILLGDAQMEWDNKNAVTKIASLWDRNTNNYYASTTNLLIPPTFATNTIITSKDHAGGDGVRVIIE